MVLVRFDRSLLSYALAGLWVSMRHRHSAALLRIGILSRVGCWLAVGSKVFVVPTLFSCSSLFSVSQRELILALAARHSVCALKTRSGIARAPCIRQPLVRCLPLLRGTRKYDWSGRELFWLVRSCVSLRRLSCGSFFLVRIQMIRASPSFE